MLSFLLFLPGLALVVMASGLVFFLFFGFSEQDLRESQEDEAASQAEPGPA